MDSLHSFQEKQSLVTLDSDKLHELESANRILQEQLENSRVIQKSLDSEVKYLQKEKNLLREEIRELSLKIASECALTDPVGGQGRLGDSNHHNPSICSIETKSMAVLESSGNGNFLDKARRKAREEDFNVIMTCFKERGGVMDSLQEQMKTCK